MRQGFLGLRREANKTLHTLYPSQRLWPTSPDRIAINKPQLGPPAHEVTEMQILMHNTCVVHSGQQTP